jgi:pyruvate/2-oxoglutarate dehydrogenase complex dihydrolipoamide acyltransferase (E2) component
MIDATVVEWLEDVGSAVVEGEPLLVIETEKMAAEVTSPGTGVLRYIAAPVGTVVKLNQVVGVIAGEDEDISEVLGRLSETPVAEPDIAQPERKEATPAGTEVRALPAVRRLAREHGIDLRQVTGSGPRGRITSEDVLQALEEGRSTTEKGKGVDVRVRETIPLLGIRKTIADRLSRSKRTTAEATTVAEVHMESVNRLREEVAASYTAFVVKAAGYALQLFPILNSALVEDTIVIKEDINIGVAVATERGLIVPVIRAAGQKSLLEISEEINDLGERARANLLSPQDFLGGTFSVTNSGVFGSLFFTPIINYPEAAILGMGKVYETPVVRDHQVTVGSIMYLALTYDHRIIDGRPAVEFLQEVKRLLENPDLI